MQKTFYKYDIGKLGLVFAQPERFGDMRKCEVEGVKNGAGDAARTRDVWWVGDKREKQKKNVWEASQDRRHELLAHPPQILHAETGHLDVSESAHALIPSSVDKRVALVHNNAPLGKRTP